MHDVISEKIITSMHFILRKPRQKDSTFQVPSVDRNIDFYEIGVTNKRFHCIIMLHFKKTREKNGNFNLYTYKHSVTSLRSAADSQKQSRE
jgi:hypothetical protein